METPPSTARPVRSPRINIDLSYYQPMHSSNTVMDSNLYEVLIKILVSRTLPTAQSTHLTKLSSLSIGRSQCGGASSRTAVHFHVNQPGIFTVRGKGGQVQREGMPYKVGGVGKRCKG